MNALLAPGRALSGINGVLRPGIVHRIDKNTSGLLIVAKNDRAHQGLAEQIQAHSFKRLWMRPWQGHLRQASGTVEVPIGRHPADRKKMAVVERHSRPAVTHYRVLTSYPGYDHVELRLETGRTHQIRVHMISGIQWRGIRFTARPDSRPDWTDSACMPGRSGSAIR